MAQQIDKEIPQSQVAQGIEATSKNFLGSITKLGRPGDSYTEKTLNKLGSVLRRNNEKGLRDKYTMSEVSKCLIKMYRSRMSYYQKYRKGLRVPLFNHNTFCGNILADASSVKRSDKYKSIINTHIAHCSSVWLCPVCSSIIQTRRANEVQRAIDWANGTSYTKNKLTGELEPVANDNDFQVIMITYTASHNVNLSLIDFGERLQKAYMMLMKNIRKSRKKYEVGYIKGVEFTHSYRNGWHKHYHVILILKKDCDVDAYFSTIQKSWETACIKYGLLDSTNEKAVQDFRQHSVDLVKSADEISNYVNKSASEWTLADEMSKSVLKIGHNTEHRTPFQILSDIATTKDKKQRYKDIEVFIEYMLYTYGLHQQDWSNGLKDAVGIRELTDEEIMEEHQDTAEYIAGLTVAHWHLIRSRYQRIQYYLSAKEGYESLKAFFDKLDTENTLPDMLTGEQARIYEKGLEGIPFTEDEATAFDNMMPILKAIAKSQPLTYVGDENSPHNKSFSHGQNIKGGKSDDFYSTAEQNHTNEKST